MPWNDPEWAEYRKHFPPRGHVSWNEFVSRTGSGKRPKARYRPGLTPEDIRRIEMSFEDRGRFICEIGVERIYYVIAEGTIGASRGEETDLVLVRWHNSGAVHGMPISETELVQQLRKHNREEFDRFQAQRRGQR